MILVAVIGDVMGLDDDDVVVVPLWGLPDVIVVASWVQSGGSSIEQAVGRFSFYAKRLELRRRSKIPRRNPFSGSNSLVELVGPC